jgi:hypothetical protein
MINEKMSEQGKFIIPFENLTSCFISLLIDNLAMQQLIIDKIYENDEGVYEDLNNRKCELRLQYYDQIYSQYGLVPQSISDALDRSKKENLDE